MKKKTVPSIQDIDKREAQMCLCDVCPCDKCMKLKQGDAIHEWFNEAFHKQIARAFLAGIKLERNRTKLAIAAAKKSVLGKLRKK